MVVTLATEVTVAIVATLVMGDHETLFTKVTTLATGYHETPVAILASMWPL